MHPILGTIRVGPLERDVTSYGVALAVALALGAALAVRGAGRAGHDRAATLAAVGFAATGGLVGAALLFFVVEWARAGSLGAALAAGPGLVFYGGFLGGAGALAVVARPLGLPLASWLDAAAVPAAPVAHAVGRVGCFLGGCCYGAPWNGPWAVLYTHPLARAAHPSVPRHPTPLYEAVGLLAIAAAFASVPAFRRPGPPGARVAGYALAYAGLRLAVETVRGDAVRGAWHGVSTSMVISLAVGVAAAAYLRVRRGAR